jgi:hypothetical protein
MINAEHLETIFDKEECSMAAQLTMDAGVNRDDIVLGKAIRHNFNSVLLAFMAVNSAKSRFYGDYVDDRLKNDPELMQKLKIYFDIRRKWKRYDSMMKSIVEDEEVPEKEILAALIDLGVYVVMAIDVIVSLRQLNEPTNITTIK